MSAPYRTPSPPEPPRTDEADTYERMLVSERSRDRRTGALLGLLGVTLVAIAFSALSPRGHTPSQAEQARQRMVERIDRAKKTVDEASRRASDEESRFDADLRAAIDGRRSPSLPFTPCALSLGEPVRGRAAFPLDVVDPGERPRSPSLARARYDLDRASEHLRGDTPLAAAVYADALEAAPIETRLVRDVVLVRTKHRPAVRSSPTSYEPGVVDGMAYVYDWQTHRVTCAGEIHATNSPALEYSFNDGADAKEWQVREPRLDATLADDLDAQVARAIAAPNALYEVR